MENAMRLIDPLALGIVGGGTLVIAVARSTGSDLVEALRSLKPLVMARPARDALVAARAVRQIRQISDIRGIALADRVDTTCLFVRKAGVRLSELVDADVFADWAREEMAERAARDEAAIAVWRSAAEVAPSMGMIGTILGLVGMFASMDDPSRMGSSMAVALLTTLYGLILSALVAGPVAARLERLALAERRWQQAALDRLEALARAEEKGGSPSWGRRIANR